MATALRAAALDFHADPFLAPPESCVRHLEDAVVLIDDGRIVDIGPAQPMLARLPAGTPVEHYPGMLMSAGFVDTHVHYPQLPIIGAYGEQLLQWLERYTFAAESAFADPDHARQVARIFLCELLRAGTTTAAVYCTVHPASVDAFFSESVKLGTRMIAGKVLMDRHAPVALLDTAEQAYRESLELIERWHGRARQHYAVTPRFAATSSPAQLEVAATLCREHPELHLQTHLSENSDEVRWVRSLFPQADSYLDVYDRAGLVGPKSLFGHGIHLDEADFALCHARGAALAHCPSANLFLGSGLFRLFDARRPERPIRVGLGSDIGAGTSLCALQNLGEAYKIAQLNGHALHPLQAWYLATRGGAEALGLADRIGRLAPGFDADIVVLDPQATPLMKFRAERCEDPAALLFMLITLGDDRAIRATHVAGRRVHDRDLAPITA